jgi:hypothetical protein
VGLFVNLPKNCHARFARVTVLAESDNGNITILARQFAKRLNGMV